MAKCGKRGGKGGKIERATVFMLAAVLAGLCVLSFVVGLVEAAGPGSTDVKFKDNAGAPNPELGFKVERHEGACGATGAPAFAEVATLPANAVTGATVSWVDTTTVAGKDFCYRARAYNNSKLDGTGAVQYSGYTNEAGVGYPLALPADPSGATAQ
jgi:hypothetical protein